MRVLLCCSLGGQGHLVPLVAVARAVERLGHEPMLLVPPALAGAAAETGLGYRVGDEPPRAYVDEIWARVRRGPAGTVAGLIDRELFADRCTAAMLPAASELRDAWGPELIVREPCEYASAVVAHEAGIPQAQVGISLSALEWGVHESVAPIVDGFAAGVAEAIAAAPYLSSFPASMDPSPWPDTRRFRLAQLRPDGAARDEEEREPLVYVSFGSVLGHLPEATAVYRVALDAVAGLPARVLMTVGHATDAASLGPVPANVRVEPWVPQDEVLRRAALVVCHGGSGTTFGALAAGVPVVICPLFADQPHNGEAVARAGAGVVVTPRERARGGLRALGPDDALPLRSQIETVLRDGAHREAAAGIAREMAAMPTLDSVVGELFACHD